MRSAHGARSLYFVARSAGSARGGRATGSAPRLPPVAISSRCTM